MPEGMNVEISQQLSEQAEEKHGGGGEGGERTRRSAGRAGKTLVEIAEVAVSAIVAIATAWSGYQPPGGTANSRCSTGKRRQPGSRADAASTRGGQELSADASMFTAYFRLGPPLGTASSRRAHVRRFTPDYKTAFVAWPGTDPSTRPRRTARAGEQRRNTTIERLRVGGPAERARFGDVRPARTAARDTAERYVRDTVLYASVLFLIAIAQRFKVRLVRMATTAVALSLAAYTTFAMLTLPRI